MKACLHNSIIIIMIITTIIILAQYGNALMNNNSFQLHGILQFTKYFPYNSPESRYDKIYYPYFIDKIWFREV